MSVALSLYFGQMGGGKLLSCFDGFGDDEEWFKARARSGAFTPDGGAGGAVFTRLFLTVTWQWAHGFFVTPVLDGIERESVHVSTPFSPDGARQTDVFVVPLSLPVMDPVDPTTEIGRVGMRGMRLAVIIEDVESGIPFPIPPFEEWWPGEVILDAVEVEFVPVRGKQAAA